MELPDIGVSGVISILIAASAIIGFIKGLFRTLLAMICLFLGGYAAFWSNTHATDLTNAGFESPSPWLSRGIAIVAGVSVLFLSRYLLNFLINPFDKSDKCKKVKSGIPAALISLLIGLVILWTAVASIRYAGSLAHIKHTRALTITSPEKSSIANNAPLLIQAKNIIDGGTLGKWQQKIDPFHTPGKLTLCRLLVMYQNTELRVAMLKISEIHRVLNNPIFIQLAFDPEMKDTLLSGKSKDLFQHPDIIKALTQKRLVEDLTALSEPQLTSVSQVDAP